MAAAVVRQSAAKAMSLAAEAIRRRDKPKETDESGLDWQQVGSVGTEQTGADGKKHWHSQEK